MKKYLLTLFVSFLFLTNFAQYRQYNSPVWTIGTAKTVEQRQIFLNLLYYSQYGITDKVEIQTKPLWWYKFPNMAVKIEWWNKKSSPKKNFFQRMGIITASKHGLYYPTPFLNYANSTGKLDFGNVTFSPTIAMKNEFLISFLLKKNKGCYKKRSIFTLKIGNQTAFGSKSNDYVIKDNSLLFRQTSIFGEKSLWYAGIDYDGKTGYGLNYAFDADFYSVGLNVSNWIFEHKGIAYWYWGAHQRIRPAVGYQFSYTNLPSARMSIYPLFDISYRIDLKPKKKQNKLFDEKVAPEIHENPPEEPTEKNSNKKDDKKNF